MPAPSTTAAAPATTRRRWTAMRISELSARGGVPIPRIKYYIREGLVPRATDR
ncbi:hypothetical protein IOD13_15945 [Brevibacterium casei]|nr:hypothetical protein [Brevibacterium casei]